MSAKIIALIVAVFSGLSMALQGSLNSVLGKVIGLLEATFIVHLVGLLVLLAGLFAFRIGKGDLLKIPQAPWYVYLGGILGVIIVYTVVYSIPRLGVAITTTAIIVGQVTTALFIDHFGLFGLEQISFSWVKGLGLVFLALGAKLMLS